MAGSYFYVAWWNPMFRKVWLQDTEATTADDPGRWLRRACASGPQVHQYIPVRFSALLASSPACRPHAKRHRDLRPGELRRKADSSSVGGGRTGV
jgi:hypothetical protein